MSEVVKLLGSQEMEAVNRAREMFPGAVVSAVRELEEVVEAVDGQEPPF